jgi:hypothetical protein
VSTTVLTREEFVEAGRRGAKKRWGRRRHLNLTELPESVRSAIEALIAAEERAQAREAAERQEAA